jgi:hypothetical protein
MSTEMIAVFVGEIELIRMGRTARDNSATRRQIVTRLVFVPIRSLLHQSAGSIRSPH